MNSTPSIHLREPNPGEKITAEFGRQIVKAIKQLQPLEGNGINITQSASGTKYTVVSPETQIAPVDTAYVLSSRSIEYNTCGQMSLYQFGVDETWDTDLSTLEKYAPNDTSFLMRDFSGTKPVLKYLTLSTVLSGLSSETLSDFVPVPSISDYCQFKTLGGAGEGPLEPLSDSWTYGEHIGNAKLGVEEWVVSRIKYDHEGDHNLYMYLRKKSYNPYGLLSAVSGETRITIDETVSAYVEIQS